MCNGLHFFASGTTRWAVALPFCLEELVEHWSALRTIMARKSPREFTRDEWAYLITFLDKEKLYRPFLNNFGCPADLSEGPSEGLVRPRGPVALWLPNNVSLLGPLMLIMISLSGNPVRIKGGGQSRDLAGSFLDYAIENLPEGRLKAWLLNNISLEFFSRDDLRNKDFARESSVRIVFGSDDAARSIEALPHPVDSVGISFSDKRSEAWLETEAWDDETLKEFIKIFTVYGQAGCTSPSKIVLINGTRDEVFSIRDRLMALWPQIMNRDVEQHVASNNIMARQWAAAQGWDAVLTERNRAVLAIGDTNLSSFSSEMGVPMVWATLDEALAKLPENIQTLGYVFKDARNPDWIARLAQTKVKRLVPLSSMHHFGHVWDGHAFWRQLFEEVEVII